MSIQAVGWVLDQDPEKLPGKAKLVLVAIANHADHTTGYCWLKLATIARESSMPERSLYRYIGALVRNGYLRKELRKGADGKQRATDYWILFNREGPKWDWGGKPESDEEAQDVAEPSATVADGESDPDDENPATETPVLADGPPAIGGSRDRDEPSKTKPKDSSYDAGTSAPRAYRPPPEVPQGALATKASDPVFVFEGTRAWEAWVAFKKRTTGHTWTLSRSTVIDGKHRTGWWFPTLFPPSDKAESNATGPPDQSAA